MEDKEVIDINADVEYFISERGLRWSMSLGCCEGELFPFEDMFDHCHIERGTVRYCLQLTPRRYVSAYRRIVLILQFLSQHD